MHRGFGERLRLRVMNEWMRGKANGIHLCILIRLVLCTAIIVRLLECLSPRVVIATQARRL